MSLYIVPTPIGNLDDITLRAIDVLRRVEWVIAEDTRHSLKLLTHLGLRKKMISHFRPKEEAQAEKIVPLLRERDAALITNAGTPAISDPGRTLISRAIAAGIPLIPLPGATALIPALAASGLRTDRFLFLGFPPRRKAELGRFLKELAPLPYVLIFYESPRRAAAFLQVAAQELGGREVVIAKEISKKNETFIRGRLDALDRLLEGETLLGEMVILISGSGPVGTAPEPLQLWTMEDIFSYFRQHHGLKKNQIKRILQRK